jgi:hypothetical protein
LAVALREFEIIDEDVVALDASLRALHDDRRGEF